MSRLPQFPRTSRPLLAPRAPGGATMMEMLVLIALLSIFALVASRVFVTSMKLARQAETNRTALGRLDHVLRELRQDVWNSQSVSVARPDRVLLRQAGGHVIWQYHLPDGDAPGALVRTLRPAAAPEQSDSHPLPRGQPAFTFAPRPAGLVVELRQPGATPRRLALPSQVQLAPTPEEAPR